MYHWENIITQIFIKVDDFCKIFEKELKEYFLENNQNKKKRNKTLRLSKSE